ncbi:MAG: PilZ domain-containing protein [Acidobacteriia bacterium]|nr:PilZ domain-containing protein [Terriglobia bacterium]
MGEVADGDGEVLTQIRASWRVYDGVEMRERRSEPRYMCSDLVRIVIHRLEGPPAEAVANLEDISPSGACVQLEAAIREGTDIEIVCANCRLQGKVRHCRFVEIGYDVGVEFEPRRAWDRRRFEPDHLLDVPVKGTRTIGTQAR